MNGKDYSSFDPESVARWLTVGGEDGATDEEFAEVFVLMKKMMDSHDPDAEVTLTKEDMQGTYPKAIGGLVADILDEVIFSEEMCTGCWWKQEEAH